MEEEIICNRWKDLADDFLALDVQPEVWKDKNYIAWLLHRL